MNIKSSLQFLSFNDFFDKRIKLKEEYEKLTLEEIQLYKMYVYSTSFETEYGCDLMWEYLNSGDDFITQAELNREWGIRQRRKKKCK